MLIGYARVSTTDQTLDLQNDALQQIGCTKIFTDTASGAKAERTGLDEALNYIRTGDTLVVWRLGRLGRSLNHLIETITASFAAYYPALSRKRGDYRPEQPTHRLQEHHREHRHHHIRRKTDLSHLWSAC